MVEKSTVYKEIKKTKFKLNSIEKGTGKYRSRLQIINIQTDAKTTDSARSKTERLLKNQIVNGIVRKKLVFHHNMIKSIAKKHKNTKRQKHCQFISKVVSSELLKRYRLKKHLPYDKNRTHSNLKICLGFRRKLQRNRSVERLQEKVRVFLERENNSNNSRGKRHSHAKKISKKQKRYL